jgi:hypothetical protein
VRACGGRVGCTCARPYVQPGTGTGAQAQVGSRISAHARIHELTYTGQVCFQIEPRVFSIHYVRTFAHLRRSLRFQRKAKWNISSSDFMRGTKTVSTGLFYRALSSSFLLLSIYLSLSLSLSPLAPFPRSSSSSCIHSAGAVRGALEGR